MSSTMVAMIILFMKWKQLERIEVYERTRKEAPIFFYKYRG